MKIKKWLLKNTTSLKDKRIVITGATGGLGQELCQYLCNLGANLTLACRSKEKTEALINQIKQTYPNANIDFIELDLTNKTSVDMCINELKKYDGIDVLINNAGIYNVKLKKCDSGYNNIFQVNFAYVYYMIKQLLPQLQKKQNSTCIIVGSIAHNYSKINKDDVDFSNHKKASKIYGNSKRFLMFSCYELFKRVKSVNLAVVHPGITLTNMTNHYPKAINWLVKIGIKILFPSPEKAVLNLVYGIFKNTPHNSWIGPKFFNIWGTPKLKKLKTCNTNESKKIFKIAENIYKTLEKMPKN